MSLTTAKKALFSTGGLGAARSRFWARRVSDDRQRSRGVDLAALIDELTRDGDATLLLGDSVIGRCADEDSDRSTIGQLVAQISGQAVVEAHTKALHAGAFAALSEALIRLGSSPNQVVVEVNLRSLAAQWRCHPAYQFREDIDRCASLGSVDELAGQPSIFVAPELSSLSVNALDEYAACTFSIKDEPWPLALYQLTNRATSARPLEQNVRRVVQLWAHYGSRVSLVDERMSQLADLVSCWKAAGSKVTAYLTPLNVGFISEVAKLVGEVIVHNVETVSDLLTCAGAQVIDIHALLPPSDFVHPEEVTEHLNAAGRAAVAGVIATHLDVHEDNSNEVRV